MIKPNKKDREKTFEGPLEILLYAGSEKPTRLIRQNEVATISSLSDVGQMDDGWLAGIGTIALRQGSLLVMWGNEAHWRSDNCTSDEFSVFLRSRLIEKQDLVVRCLGLVS